MENVQGGDITALKKIFQMINSGLFITCEKCPKLGIQLIKYASGNQSCHILTVIFKQIDQLGIMKYNIYSSNLFSTVILISTEFWGVHC